jgi:hypothetical protein
MSISAVFDAVGGALLILGAAGSGKTTSLLELARNLIARAERDETLPLPVVLPLSSWAEERLPLAAWLVDELSKRYSVPRDVGRMWVARDLVLPLLDGLDEVEPEHREACAAAIHAFRVAHGRVPLAVCCRTAEYGMLRARLRLGGIVALRPLTPQQVDAHLARFGSKLAALRAALQERKAWQQLAETPLLLNMLMIVYQDGAPALPEATSLEEQRTRLFGQYVHRMVERPEVSRGDRPAQARDERPRSRQPYTSVQFTGWLAWLAKTLTRHRQTVLTLEQIQPDWLPTPMQQWLVKVGAVAVAGLFYGLCGWLFVGRADGLLGALRAWLIFGLLFGLYFGTKGGAYSNTIQPVEETLEWSWSAVSGGLRVGLLAGLAGGLFTLVFGILVALVFGLEGGLGIWLQAGLFVGLFFGLIGATMGFAEGRSVTRSAPNKGLWRSARTALYVGLYFGLLGGLAVGRYGLNGGQYIGLEDGLFFGVTTGGLFGLVKGGGACIRHLILRLFLWRNGATPRPWDYIRFLDDAAERVLLHNVGGGYIFIHRMLQEHFASM